MFVLIAVLVLVWLLVLKRFYTCVEMLRRVQSGRLLYTIFMIRNNANEEWEGALVIAPTSLMKLNTSLLKLEITRLFIYC